MRSVVLPEGAPAGVQKGLAQILSVHAALLPTGKILYFGGDQHDPGQHHLGLFDQARLFDCQTFAISTPAASPAIRDLFCCGHAFLADGRLLVAGGTEHWVGAAPGEMTHGSHGVFRGIAEAYVFDPIAEQWVEVARMCPEPGQTTGGGRWYPTLVTLGTGHVVALSGPPSGADTRHFNNTVEDYRPTPPPNGHWVDRGTLPAEMPLYPRAHLIKDGTLFVVSPMPKGEGGQCHKWHTGTGVWTAVCPAPGPEFDAWSVTTVLLPLLPELNYLTRVLACGPSVAKFIELGAGPAPQWQETGPRTLLFNGTPALRSNLNAVLLPTGDVIVCGGFRPPFADPADAVLEIEVYHPVSNSWSTLPASTNTTVPRNYHSVALLMPDGRVWIAGSNIGANWSFHNQADHPPPDLPENAQDDSIDNRELRIELFEPWYFGRPDRPTISGAPAVALVGSTISVTTPQAATINRVVAIRAGSVTHAFNSDQRYVGLSFTRHPGGLTVSIPDKPNVIPPGPYLLFVLDATTAPEAGALAGIPSVGRHIRIDVPVPPSLTLQLNAATYHTGDTLTVVATLTPGSPPNPVDAYIVVRLPDGQFMSAQLNGPLVPGKQAIATNLVPVALQQQVAQHTFTGGEPPGTYTWMAVLTEPGTQNFVSALEEDPFTFAP